jgi:hypothetical protein
MIPLHPHKSVIKIKKWTKEKMKIKMNIMIKFKRRAMIKGGDKDDGDKDGRNSIPTPPHPRVHHHPKRSSCGQHLW